jgi:hypothetical protein
VLTVERRALAGRTADLFGAELEVPVLAVDELYGSKLVGWSRRWIASIRAICST